MSITIMIVDDHGIVRSGLASLIESEPDYELVGVASGGHEALIIAKEHKPRIAIVDFEMDDMTGLELTEKLKSEVPETRVLMLTMHDEAPLVAAAIKSGAAGFLVKKAVGTELIAAVRTLYEGRTYFSVTLGADSTTVNAMPDQDYDLSLLSPREQQVLRLIALGYTNLEIADKLDVSDRTIGTYRTRIAEKLGLKSRVEIVRFALERDILSKHGAEDPGSEGET
jgi:DNA-binding NarL/FixJ family response regulator